MVWTSLIWFPTTPSYRNLTLVKSTESKQAPQNVHRSSVQDTSELPANPTKHSLQLCEAEHSKHDDCSASSTENSKHDACSASSTEHSKHDACSASSTEHSKHDACSASSTEHSKHDACSASSTEHSKHDACSASSREHSKHDACSASSTEHSKHDACSASSIAQRVKTELSIPGAVTADLPFGSWTCCLPVWFQNQDPVFTFRALVHSVVWSGLRTSRVWT